MQYETGFLVKTECLVKAIKKCFLKKIECLASTYKSGSLRGKLPKRIIYIYIYIREFISYLNQLLHILTQKSIFE